MFLDAACERVFRSFRALVRSRRGFVVVAVAVGSGPEVSLGRRGGRPPLGKRTPHCLRASVTQWVEGHTAVRFRHGFWSAKFVDFFLVRVSETASTRGHSEGGGGRVW